MAHLRYKRHKSHRNPPKNKTRTTDTHHPHTHHSKHQRNKETLFFLQFNSHLLLPHLKIFLKSCKKHLSLHTFTCVPQKSHERARLEPRDSQDENRHRFVYMANENIQHPRPHIHHDAEIHLLPYPLLPLLFRLSYRSYSRSPHVGSKGHLSQLPPFLAPPSAQSPSRRQQVQHRRPVHGPRIRADTARNRTLLLQPASPEAGPRAAQRSRVWKVRAGRRERLRVVALVVVKNVEIVIPIPLCGFCRCGRPFPALYRRLEGPRDVGASPLRHLLEPGLSWIAAFAVLRFRVRVELKKNCDSVAVAAGCCHMQRRLLELFWSEVDVRSKM